MFFSHKEAAVGPWNSQTQRCRVAPGWQGPSGQRHEGSSEKPHYIQQRKCSLKLKHESPSTLCRGVEGKVTFTIHSSRKQPGCYVYVYIHIYITDFIFSPEMILNYLFRITSVSKTQSCKLHPDPADSMLCSYSTTCKCLLEAGSREEGPKEGITNPFKCLASLGILNTLSCPFFCTGLWHETIWKLISLSPVSLPLPFPALWVDLT